MTDDEQTQAGEGDAPPVVITREPPWLHKFVCQDRCVVQKTPQSLSEISIDRSVQSYNTRMLGDIFLYPEVVLVSDPWTLNTDQEQ